MFWSTGPRDPPLSDEFSRKMPKPELHVHVEGTLELEMMVEMAARNGVGLRYGCVEKTREAYDFTGLQ